MDFQKTHQEWNDTAILRRLVQRTEQDIKKYQENTQTNMKVLAAVCVLILIRNVVVVFDSLDVFLIIFRVRGSDQSGDGTMASLQSEMVFCFIP